MIARDKHPPMIFFNIGWMRDYDGFHSDETVGRHGHLKHSRRGAEAFNFSPAGGKLYGYRPSETRRISIERLGASPSAESIDGVTVVWMALRPGSDETVIVGWYRDATVWRNAQPITDPAAKTLRAYDEYPEPHYMVEADASQCLRLPVEARDFRILSSHRQVGGFGQSPTFYDELDLYRSSVEKYIHSVEANVAAARKRGSARGGGRNMDPEKRKLVEETAVAMAKSHFASDVGGGYDVKSVERDAKGWDLECTREDGMLFVEVKGCSGSDVVAELTPNEWKQMKDPANRSRYVIYVVTDCLTEAPGPSVFHHHAGMTWRTQDGRLLEIEERPGARISSDRPLNLR